MLTSARPSLRSLGVLGLLLLAGCASSYYAMMETFGVEKREILKDRVVEGREDQEEAKRQFRTTLEAFKATSGFKGGDLEKTYEKLNGEFTDCETRAENVRSSIESIEEVATDLFDEWKRENGNISDRNLREQDKALLEQTKSKYAQLLDAMHRTEKTMDPVLSRFRDQVLYLKHNLNAAAISSLAGNVASIENDVEALIKDMEASIAEADAFIKTVA